MSTYVCCSKSCTGAAASNRVDLNGDGDAADAGESAYAYDPAGVRVSQTARDANNVVTTTTFLNDPRNPTGHTEALEEHFDGTLTRSYVLVSRPHSCPNSDV